MNGTGQSYNVSIKIFKVLKLENNLISTLMPEHDQHLLLLRITTWL